VKRDREIRVALGRVIRDARRARGLTLKQLAALADLDWSQLSKVERGDSGVSDATKERIARELGFTLPALYAAALARTPAVKGVVRAPRRSRVEDSDKHPL
jgi:transcriptional regulator with XRE-family HTH domain